MFRALLCLWLTGTLPIVAMLAFLGEPDLGLIGGGYVGALLLGALFLGIISNALPVVNISPFWQLAISGGAIIIAVALNTQANREKGRIILKRAEQAT